MKRNKVKTVELKESEKYYRIEYKSKVDGDYYWHKAIGRNPIEAMEDFKESVSENHVEEVSTPIEYEKDS